MRKVLFIVCVVSLYILLNIGLSESSEDKGLNIVSRTDLKRKMNDSQEYNDLLKNSEGNYSKHGWNHYGPGYFSLDEKTGVLKGHGGMGLFWYSAQAYGNFILELEYRCADAQTNSGIFLRVPEMPVNNDYIYHSFEIQINDAGKGIHKTGSVYDAEAPQKDAFLKEGIGEKV